MKKKSLTVRKKNFFIKNLLNNRREYLDYSEIIKCLKNNGENIDKISDNLLYIFSNSSYNCIISDFLDFLCKNEHFKKITNVLYDKEKVLKILDIVSKNYNFFYRNSDNYSVSLEYFLEDVFIYLFEYIDKISSDLRINKISFLCDLVKYEKIKIEEKINEENFYNFIRNIMCDNDKDLVDFIISSFDVDDISIYYLYLLMKKYKDLEGSLEFFSYIVDDIRNNFYGGLLVNDIYHGMPRVSFYYHEIERATRTFFYSLYNFSEEVENVFSYIIKRKFRMGLLIYYFRDVVRDKRVRFHDFYDVLSIIPDSPEYVYGLGPIDKRIDIFSVNLFLHVFSSLFDKFISSRKNSKRARKHIFEFIKRLFELDVNDRSWRLYVKSLFHIFSRGEYIPSCFFSGKINAVKFIDKMLSEDCYDHLAFCDSLADVDSKAYKFSIFLGGSITKSEFMTFENFFTYIIKKYYNGEISVPYFNIRRIIFDLLCEARKKNLLISKQIVDCVLSNNKSFKTIISCL